MICNIESLRVEDRMDCEPGHVRLCGTVRERIVDDRVTLVICDDPWSPLRVIGEYPCAMGAHWSDPQNGRAGWYWLVGPVPIAILPEEMQCDVAAMDALAAHDANR